jgi:exopolysaccharide biosynthesis polyprenyl glycosylphosphotransferase
MFFERRHILSLRFAALFVGDIVCVMASMALAARVRLGPDLGGEYLLDNRYALLSLLGTFLLVFYIGGMYERQIMTRKSGILFPAFVTVGISLILIMVIFYAKFSLLIGRGVLFLAAIFVFLSVCGLRYLYRAVAGYSFFVKNALVVGEGRDAASIIRLIQEAGEPNYRLLGVVPHLKGVADAMLENIPVVGSIADLRHLVKQYRVETLIVATSMAREPELLRVLRPLRYGGVEILDYASFYEQIAEEIPVDHIDDEWLLHAAMNGSRIHVRKLKRIMDVFVSALGLVLSLPLSLLAMLAIRIDSKGPLLYRQRRSGLDGREYIVLKFRTMIAGAETFSGAVWAGANDARVTRVGRFLRLSRIDEIPQLINVLRGEMSLVGPRPERPEFIEQLSNAIPFYQERLFVPPGVTGWAQVKYPYAASIHAARRKLQFDLYYIKHMSLFLDILILLRTCKTILVGMRHSGDDLPQEDEERLVTEQLSAVK